jgi:hypothetical protein
VEYKLHRVAPNSEGWLRPSAGRLGQRGVGEYVRAHGFGHEDWNFNLELTTGSQIFGYTAATPARENVGKEFGLVLATYDAGGWRAAGYYDGATMLREPAAPTDAAVEQMAMDVYELAANSQTAPYLRKMTLPEIVATIRGEFIYFRWAVPKERVAIFHQPLPIPTDIFAPGKQRMITSFNLTRKQFEAIANLSTPSTRPAEERADGEGERTLRLHQFIERNAALVAEFKASLTSFACAVCAFDFFEVYGELGRGFIECHHTKPVSKMKPGDKTKLKDLCGVCANCHRMLHHSKPMLTPEELRSILAGI